MAQPATVDWSTGGPVSPARGNVFVLSAPSGTGKSTLARRLVQEVPGLAFSVSTTTRAPRPGEVEGKDYHFVAPEAFESLVQSGGFLEWVQVYANRYGTARAQVEARLQAGEDLLLDIETVGALNVKAALPEAILIFLLPPSAEELARRLRGRGDTDEAQITLRMGHARHELEQYPAYDFLVVNDHLEQAYEALKAVILAVRGRQARMAATAAAILDGFPPRP